MRGHRVGHGADPVLHGLERFLEAGFQQLAGGNVNLNDLTGVGQSFGTVIASQAPEQFRTFLQPFIPQFDQAFNNAMSLAIAETFWIGVAATVLAFGAATFMRELPLRRTAGPAPATAAMADGGGAHGERPSPVPAAD